MRRWVLGALVALVVLAMPACGGGGGVRLAPDGRLTDGRGKCRIRLSTDLPRQQPAGAPAGFVASRDSAAFVALHAYDNVSLEQAIGRGAEAAGAVVTGYRQQQFNNAAGTNSRKVNFNGTRDGRQGSGTLFAKGFGSTTCVIVFFLVQGSTVSYDPTLQALIVSLQPAKR